MSGADAVAAVAEGKSKYLAANLDESKTHAGIVYSVDPVPSPQKLLVTYYEATNGANVYVCYDVLKAVSDGDQPGCARARDPQRESHGFQGTTRRQARTPTRTRS